MSHGQVRHRLVSNELTAYPGVLPNGIPKPFRTRTPKGDA